MTGVLGQIVRIAVPYLLAAAGGVLSERAGVVALGLEGFLTAGALAAALGSLASGNPVTGALAGLAGGALLSLVYAALALKARADQVVLGIALNLLAPGGSRLCLSALFGSASNSPRVPGFGGLTDPLVAMGVLALPAAAFLLSRTRFGLRLRAAGEHPAAAASLGVPVLRVRLIAVVLGGALAGLGGAYLSLDEHAFSDGMVAGRGFIALAALIFGRWDPLRTALACLFFAAAETLQIHLQGMQLLASQVVQILPYVLTLVALSGLAGRTSAPAALGKSFEVG